MHVPVKSRRPEEAELAKKQEELEALQSHLAELEFQSLTLRLEVAEFERVYCAKVGPLYAELDEVEALIAEQIARSKPHDAKAAQAASVARTRAEESRQAAAQALATPAQPKRSEALRDLYREAAKMLHPDLSRDNAERKIREHLMTEANLAYARGDEARLRAILEEYESSPDTVVGEDIAAELVRVIRRISLAKKRVERIEAEIKELRASELFKLKTLVQDQAEAGKDILAEMVQGLKRKVESRREHMRSL